MTLREDIFNVLNDWFDMPKEDFDRAWPDLRRVMNIPEPTLKEQFLDFSIGQRFTMIDDSKFTFIKVGENSMVRIRKEDGHARYYEDIFAGVFAHWTKHTYELKAIED